MDNMTQFIYTVVSMQIHTTLQQYTVCQLEETHNIYTMLAVPLDLQVNVAGQLTRGVLNCYFKYICLDVIDQLLLCSHIIAIYTMCIVSYNN